MKSKTVEVRAGFASCLSQTSNIVFLKYIIMMMSNLNHAVITEEDIQIYKYISTNDKCKKNVGIRHSNL